MSLPTQPNFKHKEGGVRIVFNEVHRTGNSVSGVDGATVVTNTLNSASAQFQSAGIKAGDVVVITGGADVGTYTVLTVPLETQLTVTPNWPVGGLVGQVYSVTATDFDGNDPSVDHDDPKYGSIVYNGCGSAGLFKFQAGVEPWGADALDWINVKRIIPYIDLDNITDFTVSIIPPENALPGVDYPAAQWVSGLGDYTGALMEKLLHLSNPAMYLRPGCQLKITTVGALVPQMVEVWWARARQIRPNEHGGEIFAYGEGG
jgi:hypothetical protein